MRNIRQVENLKGKRVLVRVDLNVPIKNGQIGDEFRVSKVVPTISFLRESGAKVILISHLGSGGDSLDHLAPVLSKYVPTSFVPDLLGEEAKTAIAKMNDGDVLLLENLRNYPGEKSADENFARELAELGDIYVNDAFSVSHRKEASIILLPKLLPGYAGFQMEQEVKELSMAIQTIEHPFLVILGGAKFATKLPLLESYLSKADNIFIGGALAHEFLKAHGFEVGESLVGEIDTSVENIFKNKKIILPVDVKVVYGEGLINKKIEEVLESDTILDIGTESVKKLETLVSEAKLIFWNGPLGKYEAGGSGSTEEILTAVSQSRAHSVVGGGDTVAMVNQMKIEKKLSFVSTGGGAALDFLASGTLPGIKALE